MDFSVIEGKPSNPRGELMNQLNDLMDYYDADDYSYEQGPGWNLTQERLFRDDLIFGYSAYCYWHQNSGVNRPGIQQESAISPLDFYSEPLAR